MIIGADIALNHGAIVTLEGKVLYQYNDGHGNLSTALDLYVIAETCMIHTPTLSTISVDWDRNSALWSKNNITASLMSMLISFYTALCIKAKGCDVHFVNPAMVRSCLGLPDLLPKTDVLMAVRDIIPKEVITVDNCNFDCQDAWLLAYTLSCAKEGEW